MPRVSAVGASGTEISKLDFSSRIHTKLGQVLVHFIQSICGQVRVECLLNDRHLLGARDIPVARKPMELPVNQPVFGSQEKNKKSQAVENRGEREHTRGWEGSTASFDG